MKTFRFATSPLFIVLAMFIGLSGPVLGQDAPIEYGAVIEGEITNREFEVGYTFNGAAGDVVIVEMTPVDVLGDLSRPELILLGLDGEVMADLTRNVSYGDARLVSQLPDSGEYVILATRADGRAGDSVGEFTLELLQPTPIDESPSSWSVSSAGQLYFLAEHTETFALAYQKDGGDFWPQILVHEINERNDGLTELMSASGANMTFAVLGTLDPGKLYIVEVKEALFDFNFTEVSADFSLLLQTIESA